MTDQEIQFISDSLILEFDNDINNKGFSIGKSLYIVAHINNANSICIKYNKIILYIYSKQYQLQVTSYYEDLPADSRVLFYKIKYLIEFLIDTPKYFNYYNGIRK